MSGLRLIYLAAALGAFWLAAPGWGLGRWALGPETLAALAAALWVGAEVMVRRNWIALVVLPLGLLFGLAPALPLYLFLRTRKIS
ncbi:hypothetical protein LPB142_02935 [Rhodobacter xanthinilyticus]|uniref:DUF2834 domain-containing protein n=1 Tax=Rhodobacter xanthinilyticus TaxID=1850250 RepID=A0A1D9M957_9RHOB|nr:DUF2834 domain-containing protein [Rhodobacter xanthinilyticus]AOZ68396.1 hypothetical protein LPB142_02935 [Rhodobacter xanthinilyticus]